MRPVPVVFLLMALADQLSARQMENYCTARTLFEYNVCCIKPIPTFAVQTARSGSIVHCVKLEKAINSKVLLSVQGNSSN